MLDDIKKKFIWYLALVGSIILLGWGINASASKINYKWNWGIVPQYFIFHGEVDQYASADGEATVEDIDGNLSKVTVTYYDQNPETLTLNSDTLAIQDGDMINEGDKLGGYSVTKRGVLVEGMLTTLEISFYSGILGLFIGLFTGLGRISKNPLFKGLSSIYVELVRGTPLLVQIFIFYFFIGTILEFSRFVAGCLALAVFAGAYVGEIIRAGIQSIHKGQMEAARSLGMNYFQAMYYVILPQAFKRTLPALAGQFISMIKDSSLVSVIAITDLTKAGREIITGNFATFEIWFTVAGMYLVLTFSLSMLIRFVERRFAVSD